VTALRAVRRVVDTFGDDVRDALRREAARSGTLHATTAIVVATFGAARSIELPFGLEDTATPPRVGEVLGSIDLTGDDGPGGSGVVGHGALPFDPAARAGLVVPTLVCAWHPGGTKTWITHVVGPATAPDPVDAAWAIAKDAASERACGEVLEQSERPSRDEFANQVRSCLEPLQAGELDKVVLARAILGRTERPIDPARLASTLTAADPACDLYSFPAPPGRFVGASPELIVATTDSAVHAHPLAGTVSLSGDTEEDEERIAWLLASEKNRLEHAIVVDDIVARLRALCDTIDAAEIPTAVRLSTDARLGTWIDGKLSGPIDAETAMATLAAVHPTPAVGGHPRGAALRLIQRCEPASRGPWAGPVGWVDADGTSTWTLGLRGVRVHRDGFEAWGGAGIVAASDPLEETDETEGKLASVLRALAR
jgi:isochorismate synthase